MRHSVPARDEIRPDTPLRLSVAAALAFPDGSMTASGLRRECARGRLVVERIAGKDYTMLVNIDRMRELCRVQQKESASGFGPKSGTSMAASASVRCGSFETDRARSARAALHRIAKAPSALSASTSQTSTNPIAPAAVIPSEILIADVLSIYLIDVAPLHSRENETKQRVLTLDAWWSDKTLADVNAPTAGPMWHTAPPSLGRPRSRTRQESRPAW